MKKLLIALTLVIVSVVMIGFSPAAAKEKIYVMKYGQGAPMPKEWTMPGTPIEIFKKEIETRSNGRIKVEIFPNSQLGGAESMVNQLKQGIIQAASAADGHFASHYPNIQVFGIPYLFIDRVVAWDVIDGNFGKMISDDMAKTVGFRALAWFDNGGFRHYSNNKRQIKTVSDMKGLKIRTMNNPMHMEIVKNLGAAPTPVNWRELYSALQTGVVDGQENSITVFRMPKLEEVQKYIVLDGHVFSLQSILINEKWYQSLPDDLRHVVDQSAQVAKTVNHAMSVLFQTRDMDELTQEGVEIYNLPLAEKRKFKALTQEPAINWLQTKIDPKWVDLILDETAKAEKRWGY